MGKNLNHWNNQLELAKEAEDSKYIEYCEKMKKQYIDEEDLEDEDDEWDDDLFFGSDADLYIQFSAERVGQWEIGNGLSKTILPQDQKPKWIHRFFIKHLLGWKWVDKK
jgi:hypothetical protein